MQFRTPLLLAFFLLFFLPNPLLGKTGKDHWDGAIKLINPTDPSSKKKNQFLIKNLRQAIKAIEKLSGCFDQKVKRELKKIAGELETALKEGRILYQPKAEKMGKARAYTTGKGKKPEKKKVVLAKDILLMAFSACSEGFISLLDIVLHEGCHLLQDIKSFPFKGTEREILEWKIYKLSLEARAYFFAREILAKISEWLDRMFKNRISNIPPMKGLPSCMEIWKTCSSKELNKILERISKEKMGIHHMLGLVLKKDFHGKDFTPKKIEEIVKRIRKELLAWKKLGILKEEITEKRVFHEIQKDAKIGWYHLQKEGPVPLKKPRLVMENTGIVVRNKPPVKVDLSFIIDSDSGTIGDMKVPEIRFPQDAAILWDRKGEPWLFVVGFNHLSIGSGTVVAIPADPDAIQTSIHKGRVERVLGDFRFLPKKRRVILKNSIFLPHPTSFLMLPGKRLHIWDPNRGGVFELVDTSGDAMPDFLDQKNKLPLSREWKKKLENMAEAEWTGTSIRIYLRALLPLHSYEGPVFYGRDEDGDGIFEKKALLTPSTLPSRSPVILGDPVPGGNFIHVDGVPGHRIVILSRFHGAPLEDERVKGLGRIGRDGSKAIPLQETVFPFEMLRAIDLTNGSSSGFYSSSRKIASISDVSSYSISFQDLQEIVVYGYGLWTVRAVRIDGANIPFYRQGNHLHLLIFPRKGKAEYELRLELLDGTSITPGYTLDGKSGEE